MDTSTTNPLLDTDALPRFAEITPEMIAPALDVALAEHQATVAAIKAAKPTDFASVWLPYERANTRIDAIWSAVSHLHGVADTPDIRAAHAEAQRRLTEHSIAVGQDRDFYDILVGLTTSPDFAALPVADRVAVEHAVRDFRLSGVSATPCRCDTADQIASMRVFARS